MNGVVNQDQAAPCGYECHGCGYEPAVCEFAVNKRCPKCNSGAFRPVGQHTRIARRRATASRSFTEVYEAYQAAHPEERMSRSNVFKLYNSARDKMIIGLAAQGLGDLLYEPESVAGYPTLDELIGLLRPITEPQIIRWPRKSRWPLPKMRRRRDCRGQMRMF